MLVKSIKVLSILVVAVVLVSVFVQVSDFSVAEPNHRSTKFARQSNGAFIEYYQNGKIASEEFYKDGFRYGKWRFYYEDGTLKQELNYTKGSLDGEQRYFSIQGQIIYTENFEEGELQNQTIKNDSLYQYEVRLLSNGKLLFEQRCVNCHLSKKGKVIRPYYLQKMSGDSLSVDTLLVDYLNKIHTDTLDPFQLDSLSSYDAHAIIHYIDKQYQTAQRRPKQAVRLRKIRINKKTPQL